MSSVGDGSVGDGRYVIIGAGGIGVTFAAELHRAGRDVVLVARGAQLDALRSGELWKGPRMSIDRPSGPAKELPR
jgi:glycine/D-amino acid oxidase-like deaminating enzyme